MKFNRRHFLKQTGIGLGTVLMIPNFMSCENEVIKDSIFKNIGLQLYTLRDLLQHDPKRVLQHVAKIGYKHVETYGLDVQQGTFWGLKIDELKSILKDVQLKTHSGHYDFSRFLDSNINDSEAILKYIEVANTMGQEYIVVPSSPMNDISKLSTSDYQYFAQKLNEVGQKTKEAGIKMIYHNHFWEFRKFGNGTKGLDILLAFTDPELVGFELDIFWTVKAGESPQAYFEKYPNRFPLWHIKDMDRSETAAINLESKEPLKTFEHIKFTEVGRGSIDFKKIALYKEQAGLKYAFVEQDEIYMSDKMKSISASYDYIRRNLVGK